MDSTNARVLLEKQLRSAIGAWERLPILIALTKELNRKDSESVHRYAVEAYSLAKELNDPFWIGCSLCAISLREVSNAHYSPALHNLQKASKIFGQINDFNMKARTDVMIARIYLGTGDYTAAMRLLLESLNIFNDIGTPYLIAYTLCSIGDLYRVSGAWEKGLKYYRRAVSFLAQQGPEAEIGLLYHRLAITYRTMGDPRRYRKYMLLSLADYQRRNDKSGTAIALGNIANSYLDEKLFLLAEKYVRKSGKLYHELGYVAYEATSWARLGTVYDHKGELQEAFRYFRKAIALARTCEEELILGTIYEKFGMLCVKMGRTRQGFSYLRKAVRFIDKSKQPFHQYQVHETLAAACELAGEAGRALEHYKEAARIKGEYLNSQKILDATNATLKKRILSLSQDLKKEQSKNDNLKKMIETKEAELVSLTLSLIQDTGTEERKTKGREEEATEKWGLFARQFHKVHHDFYGEIIRRFPALTPTEVKVSSLIRIGLSTKEIADVLCISKRTVETHRNRIHKKLELPSRASLSGFIARL